MPINTTVNLSTTQAGELFGSLTQTVSHTLSQAVFELTLDFSKCHILFFVRIIQEYLNK